MRKLFNIEFENKKDAAPFGCAVVFALIVIVGGLGYLISGFIDNNMYWFKPAFTVFSILYILKKINVFKALTKIFK